MSARFRALMVGLLGVLTLATLTACGGTKSGDVSAQSEHPGQATVVGMTFIPNVQFSPVYVAEDKGFFADRGVDVQIRHHGSDEGLFGALVSGEEQVTVATGDEVLQARSQGLDVVSIGAYYHKYPVEIITAKDSSIRDFEDLKGKSVGLPGEYGSNWFGLLAALQSVGLTVDDIEVVSTGFTQAAALVAGDVDAIVGFSNSEAVQLEQMDFPTRILPLAPGKTPLVAASIVTTDKWLSAHPAQARAVVAGITDGIAAVMEDPQVGLDATMQWDPTLEDESARQGALATLAATAELWRAPDGGASAVQDLETWAKMGPFLADILAEPDLADEADGAVTNEVATND